MPDLADLYPGSRRTGSTLPWARSSRAAAAVDPRSSCCTATRTNVMWHRVAPALAQRFSLVIPDLPGYGRSVVPRADEDHAPYDKRSIGHFLAEEAPDATAAALVDFFAAA